jgi:hypothetical protein
LGIEGVKINLDFPSNASKGQDEIKMVLSLSSLSKQKIKNIHLVFKEVYKRGKGDQKRISDYVLDEWKQNKSFEIDKKEVHFIPIRLKPKWQQSAIDKWQERGLAPKVIGGLAKRFHGVSSKFYIEVNLNVSKTKLNPYYITRVEFSQ